MTLETFLKKFDTFVDAPNTVVKMRELVLRLATTGKLIPTDGSGWKHVPLNEIASARMGKTILKNELSESGIAVYSAGRDNSAWGHIAKSDLTFHTGTIVISARGTIGFPKIPAEAEFISTQTTIAVTPTSKEIDSGYFCLQLQTVDWRGLTAKTAIPMITVKQVYAIGVRYPNSLAEQKRIVAKVDELMALCDRLEAQQQERETRHAALARASLARFADAPTPANLNLLFDPLPHSKFNIQNSTFASPADLRKSILTLAVQGKLVPQDNKDEPLSKSFPGLKPCDADTTDHPSIPNEWALCSYRSLTSLVTSGSRGWKEYYSDKGAIFIRTQNIKTDSLVLDDVAFVDLPKSAEGMRSQVLKHDIMITITGANVTKAARVEEQIPEAYISQHIALTRPSWSEMSQWLHLCFISHASARGLLEQLAYGDKPGLNLSNIRDLVLPIPPLAEQRRIVAKVDELMALVDALETQLATARSSATQLLQAAVAELTTA